MSVTAAALAGRAYVTMYCDTSASAIDFTCASSEIAVTPLRRRPPLAVVTLLRISSRDAEPPPEEVDESPLPETETAHRLAPDLRIAMATSRGSMVLTSGELK